jgi:Leucine-rich repeat (LRR) protein
LLLSSALAATDCEILNSGIPLISATACCTQVGFICVNYRVTEMYAFLSYLFSEITGAAGQLPLEIGNLTELTKLDIRNSDLSGGPIPDSLSSCTKLYRLVLEVSKLTGNANFLLLQGTIPNGIGDLTKLTYLNLNDNQISGEMPIGICNLIEADKIWLYENKITGNVQTSYCKARYQTALESLQS